MLLVVFNLPCLSLQIRVTCGPAPQGLCFHDSPVDPRGQSGHKGEDAEEEKGKWTMMGKKGMNGLSFKKLHAVLHSPFSTPTALHPNHPLYFLLCSSQEGQTSTDWIWFICARIIWTLLRIFFWWPANVTPILRMSLWGQTETDAIDESVQKHIYNGKYI